MHSVIILSSSPAPTFAQSPTPVTSSSPLPSPSTLFGSQATQQSPRKFKSANTQRNGFSAGFCSGRTLLGVRPGAENIPIRSPIAKKSDLKLLSPKRFKSTATTSAHMSKDDWKTASEGDDPINEEDTGCSVPVYGERLFKRANTEHAMGVLMSRDNPKLGTISIPAAEPDLSAGSAEDPFQLPSSSPPDPELHTSHIKQNNAANGNRAFSPLNIDFATARRTDWTPAKEAPVNSGDDSPSADRPRSFSSNIMGDFGYVGDTAVVTPASRYENDTAPTKRRRLETIKTNASNITKQMLPPNAAATKRAKAPSKKALTITGLATSNYLGMDAEMNDPYGLDRFLSTQAQELEVNHGSITAEEVAKVRKVAQKGRANKMRTKKSTLASPTSAIRCMEKQDSIFGYASQLAREESPKLLRDTIEAIQRSTSYNLSSPVGTQDTAPISIDSATPKVPSDIARFTKARRLWQAADRDEDNALLHVDAFDIDMFETPTLRSAFPGKDVLIEASSKRTTDSRSLRRLSPSLRGGGSPGIQLVGENFRDVKKIVSMTGLAGSLNSPRVSLNAIHTTSILNSPRKRGPTPAPEPVHVNHTNVPAESSGRKRKSTSKKTTPKKPAFAGFTTEKLQKQIAAFGFKTMKKREQMIAVLEKCWDQKHAKMEANITASAAKDSVEVRKHADHLSTVHGLAARPIPRAKKGPKEPRPRKKRDSIAAKETNPNQPKAIRRRKSKAGLTKKDSGEADNLANLAPNADILTEEAMDAIAQRAIERSRGGDRTSTATRDMSKKSGRTPPVAISLTPTVDIPDPSLSPRIRVNEESFTNSTSSTSVADVDTQISRAVISYKAPLGTNHQKNPTWHEKMLMYDPIILEDLALWLNTVGLNAIGEDREVSALQVRDWCEKRGVCCLWRGGWRGNKAVKE